MSRAGTKIKCSVCKEYGHNKKTCEKKMAATTSTMAEPLAHVAPSSQSVREKAMVHILLYVFILLNLLA